MCLCMCPYMCLCMCPYMCLCMCPYMWPTGEEERSKLTCVFVCVLEHVERERKFPFSLNMLEEHAMLSPLVCTCIRV
jgi:hypothetical protein